MGNASPHHTSRNWYFRLYHSRKVQCGTCYVQTQSEELLEGTFKLDTKIPLEHAELSSDGSRTLTMQEMLKTELVEGGSSFQAEVSNSRVLLPPAPKVPERNSFRCSDSYSATQNTVTFHFLNSNLLFRRRGFSRLRIFARTKALVFGAQKPERFNNINYTGKSNSLVCWARWWYAKFISL